jgi:thiol-disulfide isomerase/thioredoxin
VRSPILALAWIAASCGAGGPAVAPSQRLVPVPVYAADARATDLAALAAGRPLVIDFFASWCEACRPNLAPMNALAEAHAGEDLVVVGVDVGETDAVVRRYVAREGIRYPVFMDPDMRFQDSLGDSALPLVLVVDGAGAIVHRSPRLDAKALEIIRDLTAPRAAARLSPRPGP